MNQSKFTASKADNWTNLFHRKQGWTGSDGIYSVAFNANEHNGSAGSTKTLFIFGDTFIGDVDAEGRRIDPIMINNTAAILEGGAPREEAIQFLYRQDEAGQPVSLYVPTTPKAKDIEGAYYWLQDGIVVGSTFYCFPMIIGPNPDAPEGFQFALHGVTRVGAPIGEQGLDYNNHVQADTPLYFEAANGNTTYFGAALMAHTEAAGVPLPDGYIYVYGLQNSDMRQKMVVARVLEEQFEDFTAWRYWDGAEWNADKTQVAPIADEISSEYSVTPMSGQWGDNVYAAVFQQGGTTGSQLSMYIGDSPTGPFTEPIALYTCPEASQGKDSYVYNAKAHPHLSKRGELLASYNVNTTSMDMHMEHADIYRPRFVTIRLENE